jgi:hypothetical protein
MAPVTSRITDAYKKRKVLFLSYLKGFFPPGKPVDRVVSMLKKIRTFFVD